VKQIYGRADSGFYCRQAVEAFLLRIIEQESGGFHYQGLSSIGKTTLLRVAGSVLGGGEKGFIQSWRATSNGLEAVAELHNDSLLCLDELGQVAPEEIGRVTYMLGNGQGKVRMTKETRVRPAMEWRLVFLSTGETSLSDHMMTVNRQVHAGQEVRIISIVADASKGMGCFEELHGAESADQFANQLNSAALAYYGTPSIAFLHRLVLDRDKAAEAAKGFMEKFLKTHVPERASGEVFRAARRFSLVAFAGEYASSLGITGWPEGEAARAAVTCYKSWLDQRGSMGAGDTEAAIVQVRHFLTLHGASRFETICPDDDSKVEKTNARDRVGFRQEIPDEEPSEAESPEENSEHGAYVYYVLPAAFKRELAKGFDAATVAKALRERGHLDTESGRLTHQKRLPGMGRQRVYCILPSIFNE
jgi:putative DNA primase/helicase